MSHKVDVVIGANYGDEGKGALVHSLVKQNLAEGRVSTVVRFNGGAQAGHTVQLENGFRRIFSSLGSGTAAGARTHLSEHFLFDPVSFMAEFQNYFHSPGPNDKKYNFPQVSLSNQARIVTPFDVARNRLRHKADGDNAHGTVGMGIGETMARHETGAPTMYASDLLGTVYHIENKLNRIKKYYEKTCTLIGGLSAEQRDALFAEFILSAQSLHGRLAIVSGPSFEKDECIVFEGAQGLLLDRDDKEHFPHVTYSKTTPVNAENLLRTWKEPGCDPKMYHFCTRPYLTRHGRGPVHAAAGPLIESDWKISDPSNPPHEFQGSMRFFEMDWDKLSKRVQDAANYQNNSVVVTCFDQLINASRAKQLLIKLGEKFGTAFKLLDGLKG